MVERTPLEMTRLTAGPRHLIRTWGPRHIAYLPSGEIVLTSMGATSGCPVPNLDAPPQHMLRRSTRHASRRLRLGWPERERGAFHAGGARGQAHRSR